MKSMVDTLLEYGAHVNVTSVNKESVFKCASTFMNERFGVNFDSLYLKQHYNN